jgi:methionyl-tRNA synthetase
MFLKLYQNGYLEEKETVQPFCDKEGHKAFLADRYVEGECSICHDLGARGDQCDKCGSLLDPLEPEPEEKADGAEEDTAAGDSRATGWLINPRCKLDGTTPIKKKTKHAYIRLDALKDKIVDWFSKASVDGKWSSNCIHITQSWIDKGLKPRGITRDLKWGTPIPIPGYENKVMYVWFDACIGYSSITKTAVGDDWVKWWKDPDNVRLYQFMGKDNVQFHAIIYPATQLGTGDNWTHVHHISTTEYLNYEKTKFSKSKGVGVFGSSAKETGVPADIWRYYLLSRRPETGDAEFMWNEFIDANNNDLLKNLGNFVNRVIK